MAQRHDGAGARTADGCGREGAARSTAGRQRLWSGGRAPCGGEAELAAAEGGSSEQQRAQPSRGGGGAAAGVRQREETATAGCVRACVRRGVRRERGRVF